MEEGFFHLIPASRKKEEESQGVRHAGTPVFPLPRSPGFSCQFSHVIPRTSRFLRGCGDGLFSGVPALPATLERRRMWALESETYPARRPPGGARRCRPPPSPSSSSPAPRIGARCTHASCTRPKLRSVHGARIGETSCVHGACVLALEEESHKGARRRAGSCSRSHASSSTRMSHERMRHDAPHGGTTPHVERRYGHRAACGGLASPRPCDV